MELKVSNREIQISESKTDKKLSEFEKQMASIVIQFELLQKNMTTAIYDGIKNAN